VFSPRQFLYDLYKDVVATEHQLIYLFLEITRSCNLTCLHCGSDCGTGSSAVLTPESWYSIVDYCAARFSRDLLFVITGGEPLLCPFLDELGKRIASHGMRWGIVTNGLELYAARFSALREAGMASITISLDGTRRTHGYLRNSEIAYDRAIRAIQLVSKSNIAWKDVVTCVYPGNLEQLDLMASRLLELGIPRWRLFRIFPRGRAVDNAGELFLSDDQYSRMIEWIAANRPALISRGLTVDLSCEGWLPFSLDRKVRTEPFFCRAGISIASILCDGTVTGCPNNGSGFHVGNVRSQDFAALWEKGFGSFRDRRWMKKEKCACCGYFSHCRGGSIHTRSDNGDTQLVCFTQSSSPRRDRGVGARRAPRRMR
jgi:radical SAM protein with 4Fe4S-binding SPASM domain